MRKPFCFYEADSSYVVRLSETDARIPRLDSSFADERDRFLYGVVVYINGYRYFAPITPCKTKQKSNVLIKNTKGDVVSSVRFSFMFPVPDSFVRIKDIAKETDEKHRRLLYEELDFCRKKQGAFSRLAKHIHSQVVIEKNPLMIKNCCDFEALEKICDKYVATEGGYIAGFALNRFASKYNLTREQSVFVAKRNIVDYIYKSAKLEGLGVTYPDTDAIIQGAAVSGVKVSDVITINNLKHAWQFLLDTLDVPVDWAYLCKLNQFVGGNNLIYGAGYIRTLPVKIGGTGWMPEIPVESDVKAKLRQLESIPNATERAVAVMLYCMRGQFFLDGNKRTAMLAANQIMVAGGQGVISVPEELVQDFSKLLIGFYESDEADAVSRFVYENCIDGMNFENAQVCSAKEDPQNDDG
jgi:hypothetical protein